MSDQLQMREADEEVVLNLLPGSGEEQNMVNHAISGGDATSGSNAASGSDATWCCADRYYRRLAICSVICGLSCIGCKALIYSVKAEEATDPEKATEFSRGAKKFGIISIVLWFTFLASIPILLALVSYLLTLKD